MRFSASSMIRAMVTLAPLIPFATTPAQATRDSVVIPPLLTTIAVTATRAPKDVFQTASPLSVFDSATLARRSPASVVDLFRDAPGLDVIGVGANQLRPSIRGQRGQRILILMDGLRLGNTRRQQDFGEIPALVDITSLDRVEVVRGPASVLYGSDAIGGVVNLITAAPRGRAETPVINGRVGYRYGDAGSSNRGDIQLGAHSGGLSLQLTGSLREVGNYSAPAGRYGDAVLKDRTTVIASGVQDNNVSGYLGWRSSPRFGAYLRGERYAADDAGFGLVEPDAIDPGSARVQILYPTQNVSRLRAGFDVSSLSTSVADRLSISVYGQQNGRDLAQNIFVPFGPGTPPGAGVDVRTRNRTDVSTVGFRAEFTKVLAHNTIVYGADYFRDDARGRDSSVTTVVGFGPPRPNVSLRTQVPNATLGSAGLFIQNDVRLHDRLSLIVGGRYQDTQSEPRAAAGAAVSLPSASVGSGVYSVNALLRATEQFNLVATVGRGFRAPNLVERYFDGPTPEGSAYQSATPDLKPERSLNIDLGGKLRTGRVSAELFVFQNQIRDGVQINFAGDSVGRLPRFTNVNVASLRVRGAEASVAVILGEGWHTSANWSRLLSRNVNDPTLPVGDVFSSKANVLLGWRETAGRWWAEYNVRRNGDQRDIVAGVSPVGDVLPAFVVQSVRAGARLPLAVGGRSATDVSLQINNLTDRLYAEVANAGFFRPEAGRNVVLTLSTFF